jgi:hypothetical protein
MVTTEADPVPGQFITLLQLLTGQGQRGSPYKLFAEQIFYDKEASSIFSATMCVESYISGHILV